MNTTVTLDVTEVEGEVAGQEVVVELALDTLALVGGGEAGILWHENAFDSNIHDPLRVVRGMNGSALIGGIGIRPRSVRSSIQPAYSKSPRQNFSEAL